MEVKPGYKQTEVGVIPEEWQVKRLGELASVTAGGTPSRTNPRYWNGDIPWITTSEVDCCTINRAEQFITKEGLKNSAARLLPPGTFLMALYGQGKTRGKIGVLGIEAATNQACAAISLNRSVSRDFMFHFLASQYEAIRNLSNTGNQENLNGSIVRSISILLPPEPEQRGIAAALSDVDALIGALAQLIAKKHDLKQAAMQHLLTGQTRLPGFNGEWEVKQLGDVATLHRENIVPENSPNELFVHFSLPAFDSRRGPVVELGAAIGSNKFRVPADAVLVSKLNPRIPRVWAPVDIPAQAVCSTEFLVLVPKSEVSRGFLHGVCSSSFFCEQMELAATGTTGSHQRMNPADALNIEVPFPNNLPEQTAIASVLSDMDAEIAALEARLAKTRALKQGMMQELLTGRTRLV